MGKKIGRNEKCPCNSGKKYKKCCIMKDIEEKQNKNRLFIDGHDTISSNLLSVIDYLHDIYRNHKIIDISNCMNIETYQDIQIKNYYLKTIMIAERNSTNNGVFATRGPNDVDIMVLFHGAYQCFNYKNLVLAKDNVEKMINDRI